jgi:hypothetical protein
MKPFLLKKTFAPKDEFLESPSTKPIIAFGYELRPSFGGQAYEDKLSTAERYPGLS